MVTITLYMRQQKRHWCIEQSFGLYGRGRGGDDLGEWHWNRYNIIYETSHQSRFDARYWMLGAGALGRPRGMVQEGRREEGSGWGTRVYLWRIHVDIWQNQYNIVKLKNKIKENIWIFLNSQDVLLAVLTWQFHWRLLLLLVDFEYRNLSTLHIIIYVTNTYDQHHTDQAAVRKGL